MSASAPSYWSTAVRPNSERRYEPAQLLLRPQNSRKEYSCTAPLGVVPEIAQINISDNCNLDCAICNRSSMGVGGLLDIDTILALVKELDRMGTQEIYYHGFGEPACHPCLPEMISHVSAHCPRVRQHIVTNGTWDSPELRRVLTAGKVRIRFSLHAGDADTWKRIHPSGRFE